MSDLAGRMAQTGALLGIGLTDNLTATAAELLGEGAIHIRRLERVIQDLDPGINRLHALKVGQAGDDVLHAAADEVIRLRDQLAEIADLAEAAVKTWRR